MNLKLNSFVASFFIFTVFLFGNLSQAQTCKTFFNSNDLGPLERPINRDLTTQKILNAAISKSFQAIQRLAIPSRLKELGPVEAQQKAQSAVDIATDSGHEFIPGLQQAPYSITPHLAPKNKEEYFNLIKSLNSQIFLIETALQQKKNETAVQRLMSRLKITTVSAKSLESQLAELRTKLEGLESFRSSVDFYFNLKAQQGALEDAMLELIFSEFVELARTQPEIIVQAFSKRSFLDRKEDSFYQFLRKFAVQVFQKNYIIGHTFFEVNLIQFLFDRFMFDHLDRNLNLEKTRSIITPIYFSLMEKPGHAQQNEGFLKLSHLYESLRQIQQSYTERDKRNIFPDIMIKREDFHRFRQKYDYQFSSVANKDSHFSRRDRDVFIHPLNWKIDPLVEAMGLTEYFKTIEERISNGSELSNYHLNFQTSQIDMAMAWIRTDMLELILKRDLDPKSFALIEMFFLEKSSDVLQDNPYRNFENDHEGQYLSKDFLDLLQERVLADYLQQLQ